MIAERPPSADKWYGSKSLPFEIDAGETAQFDLVCNVGNQPIQDQSVDFYVEENGHLATKSIAFQIKPGRNDDQPGR